MLMSSNCTLATASELVKMRSIIVLVSLPLVCEGLVGSLISWESPRDFIVKLIP